MLNFTKIKEFLIKHESKIVLFVGFCLISAISYQFGVLQGQKWQQKPLVIERPIEVPERQENANQSNLEVPRASQTNLDPKNQKLAATNTQCAYVGSKNSTKFYFPTCSYAKRVKPENLVCFETAAEALAQGRTESKCK